MLYPNNIKKDYQKTTTYSNRGMDLEGIIESTNEYYRDNDIAYIYKKPTPIGVTKVAYSNKGKRIQDGFYKVLAGFTTITEVLKLIELDDEIDEIKK